MGLASAAGRKFPIGLGGQAKILSRQFIQPVDEFPAVFPVHLLDGALQVASCGEVAGVGAHHRFPQGLGHLGLAQAIVGHGDVVNGPLVALCAIGQARCRSHDKEVALDGNHLERHAAHADGPRFSGCGHDDDKFGACLRGVVGNGDFGGSRAKCRYCKILTTDLDAGDAAASVVDAVAAVPVEDGHRGLFTLLQAHRLVRQREPVGVAGIHRDAQAHGGCAHLRVMTLAARHAAGVGTVVPRAAAHDANRPRERAYRVMLGISQIGAVPVLAPLHHVAAHVVQGDTVLILGHDVMGRATAVVAIPAHIVEHVATRVDVSAALVCPAGGKLPLGLGGQAELCPQLLVETINELLALVPGDPLDRQPVALEMARVVAHHGMPQLLADLGAADVIGRERDLVGWIFVLGRKWLLLARRAHGEGRFSHVAHRERHAVDGIVLEQAGHVQQHVDQCGDVGDVVQTVGRHVHRFKDVVV